MKIRSRRLSALVAASMYMLCAGIGIAQGDGEQRASELKIYTFGEINMNGYEVVGRPWVDSWRSAFWLPTFPSAEQAIEALKTEAASRGADGLVHVFCLDQGHWEWSSNKEPAYLCYGTAIRVQPNQG